MQTAETRVLEEAEEEAEDDDALDFLENYDHTIVLCLPDTNAPKANGRNDTNAILYRLCPSGDESWDGNNVCTSNYGEYLVSLQEYLAVYWTQFPIRRNDDDDDAVDFDPMAYGTCAAYNDDYYLGPSCTKYGTVKLTLYTDQYCLEEATYASFLDTTGYRFSSGGLVPSGTRFGCNTTANDDDYGDIDYCNEYYQLPGYSCESRMQNGGGDDTSGCTVIREALTFPHDGGAYLSLIWFFLLAMAIVAGIYTYVMRQNRKKSTAGKGDALMKEDPA